MSELLIDGVTIIEEPELVLFDKDGTLIDIHHYWTSMIKIRASLIIQKWFIGSHQQDEIKFRIQDAMGANLLTGRMKSEGPVGIKPRPFVVNVAADVVRAYGVTIINDEMENVFAEVDKQTSEDLSPLLRLLPGVKELLEQLKVCGILAAVVSTDITTRAKKAMEILAIEHYFKAIIGGDSVKNTKPEPDLALLAIQKCGCIAEKSIVIGDHPVDIFMGEHAGITNNVGVLNGLSDNSAFQSLKCFVIPNLHSITIRC